MRILLSVALVLMMAGSAQAQQQPQPASAGDVPAADARPAPVHGPVNVQKALDLKTVQPPMQRTTNEMSPGELAEATTSSAGAGEAALQEPGTRNWWYLVAAIVAGGIILAVLL
jgi:hypothetical protein